MREQDELALRIAAGKGTLQAGAMAIAKAMRGIIVDAGQVETLVASANCDALVAKHANSDSAKLVAPRLSSRIVFVITRYEIDAVAGLELGERCDLVAQCIDRPIDQVAGDGNYVG